MSTIIECPACSTRYKMNKPIPEGGRYVKCARCGHQWRMLPEEPEELVEELELEPDSPETASAWPSHPAQALTAHAAEPRAAPSWDVRRGNFAAAVASFGETSATPGNAAQHRDARDTGDWAQSWAAQASSQQDETRLSGDDGSRADDTGQSESSAAFDTNGSDESLAWSEESWADRNGASQTAAAEFDPEFSVRQALRAALEDQDRTEEDALRVSVQGEGPGFDEAFERTFGDSSLKDLQQQGLSDASYADAQADEDRSGASAAPGQRDSLSDFDYLAGSTYAAAQTGDSARTADGAGIDPDGFESDDAGVFSRQDQSKRSFSRSAAASRDDDEFTDYDGDTGAGGRDDDRYMADSPLDADAAALQAALEGSLREKHADENRTGGGLALAAAWAVFISVLSGVALAFVTFRDDIVTALPGTGALYRGLGFEVQDREIDFGSVSYRWTVTDGKPMIEVTGQIINLTDREITVPRVLINVRDAATSDPVKATATVRSEPLAANETADFTLEFLSPPKTISQIELAFADGPAE